ncbi:MAG: penicillin-binding transpeptidase domain-containing protein [Thermoguttaceae bacterium]
MPTDWQELSLARTASPAVVDPRRRLRCCLRAFVLLLAVVWCRAVQLEIGQGAAYREEALRPNRREKPLSAARGRILARDGMVLACDREVAAVAVQYRYLEDPPRQAWLEQQARKRLPSDQRRNAIRLSEEVEKLRQERDTLHRRLSELCGVDFTQWQARARKVQNRVERIAADARRRQTETARSAPPHDGASWAERLSAALHEICEPARDTVPETITVAEELADHVLAEDIPPAAAAEIQQHAEHYPGTRIISLNRRTYPAGTFAAHVLGYLGPRPSTQETPGGNAGYPPAGRGVPYSHDTRLGIMHGDLVGCTGIEQQCEALLHGQPGIGVEVTDHAGRVQQAFHESEPVAGRDMTLTIDPRLQRTAEELLDSALQRIALQFDHREPSGGAVVVIDVHNGEILAAASAPRFDPGAFVADDASRREALLVDPAHPLFHRAIQMALPPGSVFKTVTSVALLESAGLDPAATFYCQGYLRQPDRQRCEIYVRHGTGHGDVMLAEALAESCNVYFFHHAEKLPPQALVDWAQRLGFGQPTGIDLPAEARGVVPTPDSIRKLEGHGWHTADTQAISVGQGSLTATPLQVVRMMAAVANGGLLLAPHVVRQETSPGNHSSPPPQPVSGLTHTTLAAIRAGLSRAVADREGTAHGSLYLQQISVAGKTGTAVISEGQPEHAWFAGYVPADRPRYAMVVVLQRAGNAATTACPVAKRLVLRMLETGLLESNPRQSSASE